MSPRVGIAADVAEVFPGTDVRLVIAHGLTNDSPWSELASRLEQLEAAAAAGEFAEPDADDEPSRQWFDAYRRFGSNPKRTMPSFHALARRLARSGRLPRVNPAVDAYNVVSVTHLVPAGAFDLAAVDGPVEIRFAGGDETFRPIGAEAPESPNAGEVIYATGDRVLTRHWNHRDSDLTKITPATTDAVFLLEGIAGADATTARLDAAQDQLISLLRPHAAAIERRRLTAMG